MTDDDAKSPPGELTAKDIAEKFAAMDRRRGDSEPAPEVDEIDGPTRAELERWFGLPSYAQVEAGEVRPAHEPVAETEDARAARERMENAIANVLPDVLARYEAKLERQGRPFKEIPPFELPERGPVAMFDYAMIDRLVLPEPREIERPEDIVDNLKDVAPQALLRDLHRVESEFDKTFELIDFAAEEKLDIVAEVKAAMATRWGISPDDLGAKSPCAVARAMYDELRALHHTPWPALWNEQPLPNRTVTE